MKKVRILFLLLAGVLLLAGCQKEGKIGDKDAIRFTASSNPGTKTAYSGDVVNGYERIEWNMGDKIRIYSNVAEHRYHEGQHWADYQITEIVSNTGVNSKANIDNVPGDGHGNGLVWGDPNVYEFYAIYPNLDCADGASGVLSATIPADQVCTASSNVYDPDMDYAVMTAYQVMDTNTEEEGDLDLPFSPEFTAFSFDLKSKDREITVTKFELLSEETPIAGPFTVSYNGGKSYGFSGATDKVVTLAFESGTTISTTQNLKFTVFALPRNLSMLSIRFTILSDDPNETQTHTLKLAKKTGETLTYMDFPACGKYNFEGIQMEGSWSFKTITLNGQVMEWKTSEVSLSSDDLPQATQFVVTGAQNVYSDLHPTSTEAKEKYRQTGVIDPREPAKVTFKIFSPVGGTYEIKPMNRLFSVAGDLSGQINERTDDGVTTVKLTITPTRNTFYFIYTINYSDYCKLNPRTRKYEYTYDFPLAFFTNKSTDNSTRILIRDLKGDFNPKELALGTVTP
ncbi:MAG: hypothetical protein J5490_07165 [Bacteroidales bacterium]|nr:hypothetical protein [Bacteroidales bacterium]